MVEVDNMYRWETARRLDRPDGPDEPTGFALINRVDRRFPALSYE